MKGAYFAGAVLVAVLASSQTARPAASPNLLLWDTGSPVAAKSNLPDRTDWKAVPSDLLLLETDPPKASSDPGYYGRDYSFKGDAVVETPALTAVFSSAAGSVTIFSKLDPAHAAAAESSSSKIVELSPLEGEGLSSAISHIDIVRNGDDEIVLKVLFSSGSRRHAGVFSFERTGVVEVKPTENMDDIHLSGPMEYGIVPSFIGDDLIFGGAEPAATNAFDIPAENLFLGLLPGERSELMMTWPEGKQRLRLHCEEQIARTLVGSLDFHNDGRSFYLAALSAPGIWHKEELTPQFLEKDVKLQWRRPFPAKWKTQLFEEELKTTFAFRESRGDVWRGVAGSFVYPVWFDGDDAYYHLSKKIQPKGDSLIYCLESRDTPLGIVTPVDFLKETLGRATSEPIIDIAGRELRTHHRRAGAGVRRACTCGCTEAIQAVFEAGEEVTRRDYIQGALDDMIYFVHRHVERINEYRHFADGLLKMIQEKRATSPELKPFLDSVEEIAAQIPQEYEVQKENMKSFGYADDLSGKTISLTAKHEANNIKEYMDLLKDWRAMGGAQDYVLAKCHVITRHLFLESGYGCARVPGAVTLSEDIRTRCRQVLRNPDGYEIWADY